MVCYIEDVSELSTDSEIELKNRLKILKKEYHSYEKKKKEKTKELKEEIEYLNWEINKISEEIESMLVNKNQEFLIDQKMYEQEEWEESQSNKWKSTLKIQYCPNCGCFVGNNNFCGQCGQKIERD